MKLKREILCDQNAYTIWDLEDFFDSWAISFSCVWTFLLSTSSLVSKSRSCSFILFLISVSIVKCFPFHSEIYEEIFFINLASTINAVWTHFLLLLQQLIVLVLQFFLQRGNLLSQLSYGNNVIRIARNHAAVGSFGDFLWYFWEMSLVLITQLSITMTTSIRHRSRFVDLMRGVGFHGIVCTSLLLPMLITVGFLRLCQRTLVAELAEPAVKFPVHPMILSTECTHLLANLTFDCRSVFVFRSCASERNYN